jgi:hypothetical protein
MRAFTPQIFGYKLAFCYLAGYGNEGPFGIEGSTQMCPLGLRPEDCPRHWDCYIPCDKDLAFQWFDGSQSRFNVDASPYGGQAYCERFPRNGSEPLPEDYPYEYWAQVGKPFVPRANFDDTWQVRA